MDWTNCELVERVPGLLGGKPVLRKSRVSADSIFRNYLLGESPDDIADDFGLLPEEVDGVIKFAVMQYLEREQL